MTHHLTEIPKKSILRISPPVNQQRGSLSCILDIVAFKIRKMTFPEETKVVQVCSEESKVKASEGLVGVIARASKRGNIVNGIQQCASLLQSSPEQVMLCILPVVKSEEDIMINIEHKLLEAYCWENGIRVMKADCPKKLEILIHDNKSATDDSLSSDFNCVLLKFPKKTEEDWKIIDEFYKSMLGHGVPHWHVIGLPG